MAVANIQTASIFKAEWNETNRHLNPQKTLLQTIARVVWDIFSVLIPIIGLVRLIGYAIGKLAARFMLPAAFYSEAVKKQAKDQYRNIWKGPITHQAQRDLRNHFTPEHTIVITPDGVALDATFYRHRDANELTPTVITPMPNGALAKNSYPYPLMPAIHNGIVSNFALFDYRSVGDSMGTFDNMDQLVRDGSSILQWVQSKTPSNRIQFCGVSLGGAVSVNMQALDPRLTGDNANVRSLSSTEDVILAQGKKLNIPKIAKWIAKIARQQGYYLDAVAPFKKIAGRKLILCHFGDKVIPEDGSLARKVEDVVHELGVLESLPENELENERIGHHNAPLANYRIAGTNQNAVDRLNQFLFGQPAAAAAAEAAG